MNSKERVLTAVHLAQPDRVPLDLLPNPWVETRLRAELGASTHRALLERLACDVVDLRGVVDPVYRGPVPLVRQLDDGVRENIWGWRQKVVQAACGPEEQFQEFVLEDAASVEELERHPWPNPDWFDFGDFGARLAPWQDFAVLASGASVFQHATFLRRFDNLLVDMLSQPELAHWLMDRFAGFYLAFFDRMFAAAPGCVDILRIADDFGTQQGLLMSVELFRTYARPRLRQLVDMAHSHGVHVMFHSCGAIRPLIEDLIEIGVDILDPLHAAASGMEPGALKRDYGGRICLHGGICTQYLLPRAAPAAVRDEVRRRLDVLGAGGGYITAPCHVLQTDVPTANIMALVDAVQDAGRAG